MISGSTDVSPNRPKQPDDSIRKVSIRDDARTLRMCLDKGGT